MTTYNVGDIVRLTKGKSKIEGEVNSPSMRADYPGRHYIGESGAAVEGLLEDGFTLEVVERAELAVPTEPGYYFDKDGDMAQVVTGSGTLSPRYAPYTRLMPEVPNLLTRLIGAQAALGPGYMGVYSTIDILGARETLQDIIKELEA